MTSALKTVAVLSQASTIEALHDAVRAEPRLSLELAPVGTDLAAYPGMELLLYELADITEESLHALQMAYERIKQASLIVISPADDPHIIKRLMRMGARDVIKHPLVTADLISSVDYLFGEQKKPVATHSKDGMVVAFFSVKGSSGATFLAVNTAYSLANRYAAEVALIDLDIQFGNAALLLDMKPENSVLSALKEADRLDSVFLGALMSSHASGLKLLGSPSTMSPVKDIPPTAVRRLLNTARQRHDITIVDLPHLISAWTLEVLSNADRIFLVMQNNLSALRDAGMLLEFLPRQGIPSERLEVINNRAMSQSASATIDQMKQTLKRDRIRRMRNDYLAASMAEDKGQAILKSAPHSKLSDDINALADYLWQRDHGSASKESKGWLQRLMQR